MDITLVVSCLDRLPLIPPFPAAGAGENSSPGSSARGSRSSSWHTLRQTAELGSALATATATSSPSSHMFLSRRQMLLLKSKSDSTYSSSSTREANAAAAIAAVAAAEASRSERTRPVPGTLGGTGGGPGSPSSEITAASGSRDEPGGSDAGTSASALGQGELLGGGLPPRPPVRTPLPRSLSQGARRWGSTPAMNGTWLEAAQREGRQALEVGPAPSGDGGGATREELEMAGIRVESLSSERGLLGAVTSGERVRGCGEDGPAEGEGLNTGAVELLYKHVYIL